jgi:PHD/YefM family antitoxin component YafN of YafNO toxin-antitoxin module
MVDKMIEVHPNILERNGKKEFAVLPYDEFEFIMESLADYEDLRDLREAKSAEEESPGSPLAEVRKDLGI